MRITILLYLVLAANLVFGQASMNVNLQYNWADTTLPASSAHNNAYNEVWGYAKNGREYAIIGTTMGTHIHDITVQGAETEVAFIPGATQGSSIIHRDFDTYGNYLYTVCDEGPATLQIIDLSNLPDTATLVYNSDSLLSRSHNIFIDSVSARMYVCGGTEIFGVFSLADPQNPTRLINASTELPFWSVIGYIHDVFVRNDVAYCNAGPNGFYVVDFSDISDVLLLGSLTFYEQQGYNHSGWLMENGDYYCLADETHGMDLKILDVSDLSNMVVVDTPGVEVSPLSIPHNVIFRNNLLHTSYYHDGYYVWDCTNPESTVLTGYYDTSVEPHIGNYRGAWGVYPFLPSGRVLVSDMQEGLFVLDISNITDVASIAKEDQQLMVFPNPSSHIVYLNVPASENDRTIDIVNNLGQTMSSRKLSSTAALSTQTIDVSMLNKGVYHAVVRSNELTRSISFVVER